MSKNINYLTVLIFLCMANTLFSQQDIPSSVQHDQALDIPTQKPAHKLDFSQNVLDNSTYPQAHLHKQACLFSQEGQTLTLTNDDEDAQSTRESFIGIGTLCADAVIELDVLSQTHNTYVAAVMISLFTDINNRMHFVQRDIDSDKKSLFFEILKDGKSVCYNILLKEGVAPPNTLRMQLKGSSLEFSLVKGGECTVLKTIRTDKYFDLNDPAVLNSFFVCAGAKLRGGESVSFTRFEQYGTVNTNKAKPKERLSEPNNETEKNSINKPVLIAGILALLVFISVAGYFLVSVILKIRQKRNFCENQPANRDF